MSKQNNCQVITFDYVKLIYPKWWEIRQEIKDNKQGCSYTVCSTLPLKLCKFVHRQQPSDVAINITWRAQPVDLVTWLNYKSTQGVGISNRSSLITESAFLLPFPPSTPASQQIAWILASQVPWWRCPWRCQMLVCTWQLSSHLPLPHK